MAAPIQIRRFQQEEVIDPLVDYLCEHDGDPLVAAPTGVGKSVCINGFIRQSLEQDRSLRFLVCTHVKEIVAQNMQSMLDFWPDAPVGCFSAGLKQFDTRSPIVYAGVQSIYRKADKFGKIDCLICDEAHMIPPRETTMWQTLIRDLRRINPEIRICGFTATPFRLGSGTLVEAGIFTKLVVDLTTTDRINQFVHEGFLCPLVSKKPAMEIDVTNVKMKGGDFDEHELALATDKDDLNRCVVQECIRQGADRNHWLIYATGKTHASHLVDRFRACGITCEMLDGSMDEDTRTRLIGDKSRGIQGEFQQGKFRALVNIGVLSTGFDFPALDMIALVRATQSTGLYIQILGRLTRPFPGKRNGLVLDFGANITRLGAFNAPIIPKARKKGDSGTGEAPVKACQVCGAYCHTRVTVCPECGFEFPVSSCVEKSASMEKVMVESSVTPVIDILQPNVVHYSTQACKDTMKGELAKVSYSGMVQSVSEFFCPEAPQDWLRREFSNFWIKAGGNTPVPPTAEDFLARARTELKTPKAIHFISNTKYPKIREKHY